MSGTFTSNKSGSNFTPIDSNLIDFDTMNFVGPIDITKEFKLNQQVPQEEMEIEELPMDGEAEVFKTDEEIIEDLNEEYRELSVQISDLEKKKKELTEILKRGSDQAALNMYEEVTTEIDWIKERRKAIYAQKKSIQYKENHLDSLFALYPELEEKYKKLKNSYENMKSSGVADIYETAKTQLEEYKKEFEAFKNASQRLFELNQNKEELLKYIELQEKFNNTTSPSDKEYYGRLLQDQKNKMLEHRFVLTIEELNNEITEVSNTLTIEPELFVLPEKEPEPEVLEETQLVDDDPDPLSYYQYSDFEDTEPETIHTQTPGEKPTYDYSTLQTTGSVNKEDFPNIASGSQYDNYVGKHKWALSIYDENKKSYWEKLCKERGIDHVVGIPQNQEFTPYYIKYDADGNVVYDADGNPVYECHMDEHGMIPEEILNGSFYAGRKTTAIDIIMDACEFYGYDHPEDIIALWVHETACGTSTISGPADTVTPHAFGVLKGKFSTEWFKYDTGADDLNDPAQSIWGIVASFANRVFLFENKEKDPTGKQARANAFASWASGIGGFLDYGYNWTHEGNAPMPIMVFNGQANSEIAATTYGFMVISDAIAANDTEKLTESTTNSLFLLDYEIDFDEKGSAFTIDSNYDPNKLFKFHNTH